MKYADVILPVPIPKFFTYAIPDNVLSEVKQGVRVVVPFGKRKIYSAIVFSIHSKQPEHYETKEIQGVLDEAAIVNEYQLKLWSWIAGYYLCTIGDVYKAALPAGLKMESESKISLNENFSEFSILSKKELTIISALEANKELSIYQAAKLIEQKQALNQIKHLIEINAISLEENLKSKFKNRTETYITLHPSISNDAEIKEAFDSLEKAPRQLDALMALLQEGKKNDNISITAPFSALKKKYKLSDSAVSALVEKSIIIKEKKVISRLEKAFNKEKKFFKLNEIQNTALKEIESHFENNKTVLLHGVTSSGKTEIYIHLIKDCIKKGKQALYLLPEIALTAQIINRLRNAFGNLVGIYHSRFSDSERVETWNSVLENNHDSYKIILGVRSSVFLPFSNLGLIIVDEEHENTYKQYAPAPRYHARDTALVLSQIHKANIILGTATPAIESYANAQANKYAMVELQSRFKNVEMPEILVEDIALAKKKNEMTENFSKKLIEKISDALSRKEQVILFQNRRGYSPYLECSECGWIPKCNNCDVSLTYYKYSDKLACHYCGEVRSNIHQCKACGAHAMKNVGFGTEQIEDQVSSLFPMAKSKRMDLDSTRRKSSYERIIRDFEDRKIDILIGTQMVTKGLDFENVSLVGILNADSLLNFPDFRAHERSFQLMAQVGGRAGRKDKQGLVLIQTKNPDHFIINQVVQNNYSEMFKSQISERKIFKYPPFFRLISITLKHNDKHTLDLAATEFATNLRKIFNTRVLGPEYPLINRIQNRYLKIVLIKIEKDKSEKKAKEYILQTENDFRTIEKYKSVQIINDVDPL